MKNLKEASIEELRQYKINIDDELFIRYEALNVELKQRQAEREKNCDHEYQHTNSMYRGANEQQCINCGKMINS